MDIPAVIARIQGGDDSAYAAIVTQFQRPLFGYLGRMGLAQGVAEDLAQETFLRAWRRLDHYQAERGAFSTWLFTIARNLALSELDRKPQGHERPGDETINSVPCERQQPDAQAADTQARHHLLAALRSLPVQDRSVLALTYLKELDLAAVAAIEGCSPGAVKVRLHRARARLRETLEATHGR